MRFQVSLLAGALAVATLGSAACTNPEASDDPELTGTIWELQEIQLNDGQVFTAEPPQNYTAEFTEEGELFMQVDCNRAIGAFTVEDGYLISVTLGPTSLAACPGDSISDEYLQSMGSANSFFFRDDELIVELEFDSGAMVFSPANG
jgi:heat shock protein HslJ